MSAQLELPPPDRIARTLIVAAVFMDELSAWILADEAVLRGEVEINSRYVALAALAAMHPSMRIEPLGRCIGCHDPASDLAWARLQTFWSDKIVERVMVAALSGQSLHLDGFPAAMNAARAVSPLLRRRLSIIQGGRVEEQA